MEILSETTRCGRSLPGLIARIEAADCVAFEVTDGLLARRCRDRSGLFAWLEQQHDAPGFARARAKAEWLARRRFPPMKTDPVTLSEIYTVLAELMPDQPVSPEIEADTDARFLTADPTARRLLEAARAKGKRVVGIDRSGLPREDLAECLAREDLPLDALSATEDLRAGAASEPDALHIPLTPLHQLLSESPPAFVTVQTENAHAALIAGHAALRADRLSPLGLFGYTLGGPLRIGLERERAEMQSFLAPLGDTDAFAPILSKAQDLLLLLHPALTDATARQDIEDGIAGFRDDIAWIAAELTPDALRLYCQEQLSRLLLAPRPDERRLLDTVSLPDGARAGRALAPAHAATDMPDLDLLRLNETFRDLLPRELVRLAESGELADTDWRSVFRSKPFKPSLWAALRRYQKRIEKRRKSRAAER